MNRNALNATVLPKCINRDCLSFYCNYQYQDQLQDQICLECGAVQYEQKIEMDPFHFGYTQLERQYVDTDSLMVSITHFTNQARDLFEWLTEDDIVYLRKQCTTLAQGQSMKKKNTIRNLVAALLFDLIRRRKDLNQASFIKKLMEELKIKSKDIFVYLQLIDSEHQGVEELVKDQVKQFEETLRKYFHEDGQILLFQIKMNVPDYQRMSYLSIVDELMKRINITLESLYSLNVVKHFCQSKKPSRCMISLGFTALKINQLIIIPREYCKIFSINVGTLKFFTLGLQNVLVQEIERFNMVQSRKGSFQSEDSEPFKKIKLDQNDTSQSTCDMMKVNGNERQCTMMRVFLSERIADYMKFQDLCE